MLLVSHRTIQNQQVFLVHINENILVLRIKTRRKYRGSGNPKDRRDDWL
jgi:hypothetical protein